MRVLGLDIGDKTVGVAVSDPLGYTAQPLETIRYTSRGQAYNRLMQILNEYEIGKIIAGLPLNMNGSEGPQAQKVKAFVGHLLERMSQQGIKTEVEFRDERLSTVAAERILLEADLSRAKRKKVIDKMAACYILQGYLEAKRGSIE